MTARTPLLLLAAAGLAGCMNQCDHASSNAQQQAAPLKPEMRAINRLEKQPKTEMLQLRRHDAATTD